MEEVNQENYFYACNGDVLKSKMELLDFLKDCDERTFSCHANEEKNDFANWINDVLMDKYLATKFRKAISKEAMISALETRIKNENKGSRNKKNIIMQIKEAIIN